MKLQLFILKKFFEIDYQSYGFAIPNLVNEDAAIRRFLEFLRHPKGNVVLAEPVSLLKPLQEMGTFRDKLFFMMGYLFPTITFMKSRYKFKSTISVILFYFVRWGRLIKLIFKRNL